MYWTGDYEVDDMIDQDHDQDQQELTPTNDTMVRITRVQERYAEWLMQKPNVIGVGVGLQKRKGSFRQQPCLVVLVTHKVPDTQLRPEDRIPRELDGVLVDVQEAGMLAAQAGE